MVMSGSHILEKIPKHDQIIIFMLDYSHITVASNVYPYLKYFQGFQVDHFQYHNRIVDSLQESYLANSSTIKRLLISLMHDLGLDMNNRIPWINV